MSTTGAASMSLGDDAEAFHATLAFLDEYDGDIDLQLPEEETYSSNTSDTASSSWSPAPTNLTETTSSEPSHSEPDAEGDSQSEAATSPSGSPSSSPAKPLTAKKTAKRRHNSHAEDPRMSAKTVEEGAYPSRTRKAELTYLKTKVQELEERLRVIKQTKRLSDDAGDGSGSARIASASSLRLTGDANVTTENGESPSDPWELALAQQRNATATGGESMWEDVAMRQFEQRQQSEIENQRLRGMLESQLKLARGLERLLKRTNADLLLPTNSIKRPRISPNGSVDASAFDELMLVVDEMYGQLEGVFADPRFAHEDAPLRDIQVDQDSAVGTVVDVFDARNMPFDLRSTADAVWSYFVNTSVSFSHQQVEITDDVMKKHFNFTVEVQRQQANFRGRLAGRRFFEEDRIVILWVAMIEPEMPGSLSEGMVVRQKGWTIVKRPNKLPPNCDPDSPVARIQSKHVAIPYVYEDVPDHKRRSGTLTNFVLQSVYSHLQTSRKMVENILIEGAMKK